MKKTNAMRILDRKKIKYTTVSYHYDPENLDVKLIAEENDLLLNTVFKTLVLKGDKNGVFVVVIPGDTSLNLKMAAKESGNKKSTLIPVKDIEKITGYIRGGCCPIGMKKEFPVYIDAKAQELKMIYFNAGTRGLLLGVETDQLLKMGNIQFSDF